MQLGLLAGREDDELLRQRLEGIEVIREHRKGLLAQRGGQPLGINVDRLIDQMRAERGDELLAGVFGKAK